MIVGLYPILLSVKDFDRDLAFYRDTLGLRSKGGAGHSAEFDVGGMTFALHGGWPGGDWGEGPSEPK